MIDRGKVEKYVHGITAHIIGRDNEDIIWAVVSISPSELGCLTLRRRLDRELPGRRRTDLDKGRGVNRETGLSENGSDESEKEREGKESGEHDCSVKSVVGQARKG